MRFHADGSRTWADERRQLIDRLALDLREGARICRAADDLRRRAGDSSRISDRRRAAEAPARSRFFRASPAAFAAAEGLKSPARGLWM